MPKIIKFYVHTVDMVCEKVGRFVMYWVFFMMFLLILSFVTRNIINFPLMWIIEMAISIIHINGKLIMFLVTNDKINKNIIKKTQYITNRPTFSQTISTVWT